MLSSSKVSVFAHCVAKRSTLWTRLLLFIHKFECGSCSRVAGCNYYAQGYEKLSKLKKYPQKCINFEGLSDFFFNLGMDKILKIKIHSIAGFQKPTFFPELISPFYFLFLTFLLDNVNFIIT